MVFVVDLDCFRAPAEIEFRVNLVKAMLMYPYRVSLSNLSIVLGDKLSAANTTSQFR